MTPTMKALKELLEEAKRKTHREEMRLLIEAAEALIAELEAASLGEKSFPVPDRNAWEFGIVMPVPKECWGKRGTLIFIEHKEEDV